jgi:hypothetical protein
LSQQRKVWTQQVPKVSRKRNEFIKKKLIY